MNERRRLGIALVGWGIMIVLWILCMLGNVHASEHMRIVKCDTVSNYHECAVITIAGKIEWEDGKEFLERTKDIQAARIELYGPGGDAASGMLIGETIHAHGFRTYVPQSKTCQSMCAYMWIAGKIREVGPNSVLTWHSVFMSDDPKNADGLGNALLGIYFCHIGFCKYADAINLIGHDPNDIHAAITDVNGMQTEKDFRTP